jgi:hypothetical protein
VNITIDNNIMMVAMTMMFVVVRLMEIAMPSSTCISSSLPSSYSCRSPKLFSAVMPSIIIYTTMMPLVMMIMMKLMSLVVTTIAFI